MLTLALAALCTLGQVASAQIVVSRTATRTALEASKEQLITQYNQQADGISTLVAAVDLFPTTGPSFGKNAGPYHELRGVLLGVKPVHLRLIGQAPLVAKNIFDMVSDANLYRIYVPARNMFLVGATGTDQPATKPLEKLRPQHLLDALFWPEISDDAEVVVDQSEAPPGRYYVLKLMRHPASGAEVARKVWFDRADLSIVRLQIFGAGQRLDSDIHYADWGAGGRARFPFHLWIARPREDYQLEIRILRLALNEALSEEQFRLEPPPGARLVLVGKD